MATPFHQTLRSIEAEAATGRRGWMVLAPILLAAWTAWLFGARVEVLEASEDARVQVDARVRELASARAGRVTRVHVALGDRVVAGQVLVQLDDRETAQAHAQAQRRALALAAVIERRDAEIVAEREALEALERATGAAAQEARARVDAALAEARAAESALVETRSLEAAEVASPAELRRQQATADSRAATARERRSASAFTRLDGDRQVRDRLARIVAVEAEIATLEVERTEAKGRVEALAAELEQHRVRAPVAGTVGELGGLEAGAWVERGEPIGTLVPDGELEVVARFAPDQAVGRIKPGQLAQVRLAGFAWAQYGSVEARVTTVARELQAGAIVVELTIEAVPDAIVLEHGLPGSVEIEIERLRPADLLLRAAGQRLTGPRPTPAAATEEP